MKNSMPEERAAEVQKAKESSREWVRANRTWDYTDLCKIVSDRRSRLAMVKELPKRGFFITNKPHDSDMVFDSDGDSITATIAATTSASTSATATATSAPSSPKGTDPRNASSSSSSDQETADPSWQRDLPASTSSVWIKMKEGGLYQKFSGSVKLLVDFKKSTRRLQQEVDNVSRFLRYLQPVGDEPALEFLTKSTETHDFLMALKSKDMSVATVLNYIKNMIRFLDYLKTRLDLDQKDLQLRKKCQIYKEMLVSKSNSQVVCKRKYDRFVEGSHSIKDCQEVLRVSKADFLNIFGQFISGAELDNRDKTMYRCYCEAIVVFCHFQHQGAVEGLTVSE
ncbi:uncharacterized protein LOC127425713 [Myxocyprinus asiaticus]|uniref:uncharacterized protein LOC127425713 n=1 Tax=Myxocyprinus asiaticus TaxID=70543 RepID=UPI002222C1DE|nr:uncharacterized protein LOC127425713 [Myxocyprinus asiaticus]